MHEALIDGAHLLLLGAMLIGVLTSESGQAATKPFSVDLFKGMLAFFLLDMGLLTARNTGKLKGQSAWLLGYAIAGPDLSVQHFGRHTALCACGTTLALTTLIFT